MTDEEYVVPNPPHWTEVHGSMTPETDVTEDEQVALDEKKKNPPSTLDSL
jgi:hypothetical protein